MIKIFCLFYHQKALQEVAVKLSRYSMLFHMLEWKNVMSVELLRRFLTFWTNTAYGSMNVYLLLRSQQPLRSAVQRFKFKWSPTIE